MPSAPKYAAPIDPSSILDRMAEHMATTDAAEAALPPVFEKMIEAVEDDGALGVSDTDPAPPPAPDPLSKWAKED